ncbi:iron-sulfur cluster assembly scaffold protein [Candidatus Woesebacteria bacterium]|nr:iron-sulfur cluster assembly scaffold protein [Candidatus Woesebacteria bacterium]
MNDLYHEDLLDEAKNPNNFGDLADADVTTTQFNASCGDVITVSVKLSEDKTKIADIKWKGHGCIISQAAMSVLSEKIKGYPVEKIQELSQESILEELGLPEISMGRVKCLLLGLSAVKKIV